MGRHYKLIFRLVGDSLRIANSRLLISVRGSRKFAGIVFYLDNADESAKRNIDYWELSDWRKLSLEEEIIRNHLRWSKEGDIAMEFY